MGCWCVECLLPNALVCLVSEAQGLSRLGGGPCARGLICRRLLPDVCSCCVSWNVSVSVAL